MLIVTLQIVSVHNTRADLLNLFVCFSVYTPACCTCTVSLLLYLLSFFHILAQRLLVRRTNLSDESGCLFLVVGLWAAGGGDDRRGGE